MQPSDVFRSCMINLDVKTARQCWAKIAPGMTQPADDFEALMALHYGRTIAESIPIKLRVYSHEWLLERELPSGLPDHLNPQPTNPKIVEAVGVSVKAMSTASIPLAKAIEAAMSDAVADCYANGDTRPSVVRARMEDARRKVMAA